MEQNQCQLAFHLARGTNSNRSASEKSASYRMNDKFRGVQRRGATGPICPVLKLARIAYILNGGGSVPLNLPISNYKRSGDFDCNMCSISRPLYSKCTSVEILFLFHRIQGLKKRRFDCGNCGFLSIYLRAWSRQASVYLKGNLT